MEKIIKFVEKETVTLLSKMGVDAKIEVSEDKNNEALLVVIETEEHAGLLIGNRGDTLNSLQLILGIIVQNKTGEWHRILVNISDWREKQEDRLTRLAEETAERALESDEPQQLYNLSPAERRIVHMVLSENKKIQTESEGEGRDRYLLVSPKEAPKK